MLQYSSFVKTCLCDPNDTQAFRWEAVTAKAEGGEYKVM